MAETLLQMSDTGEYSSILICFLQRDRETDRVTDRETGRQTGRQTDRQTDRQTGKQSDSKMDVLKCSRTLNSKRFLSTFTFNQLLLIFSLSA